MRRYVEDFAKYKIKTVKENELIPKEMKAEKEAQIQKILCLSTAMLISTEEAIKLILEAYKKRRAGGRKLPPNAAERFASPPTVKN